MECRTDGRCQYAIDHGAEGLGHCPAGKCCMPATPINMVLHCPVCGEQHIDASEPNDAELNRGLTGGWGNPPHRSHLCHYCGNIWRPADVPTNGVASVTTRGKADTWPKAV